MSMLKLSTRFAIKLLVLDRLSQLFLAQDGLWRNQ